MKSGQDRERGSVVVGALALVSIALLLAATAGRQVLATVTLSRGALDRERAIVAAEAGLAAALARAEAMLGEDRLGTGPLHPDLLGHGWRALDSDAVGPVEVRVRAKHAPGSRLALVAEGRSGRVVRAVRAEVRVPVTGDLVWLSDFEVWDPLGTGVAASTCARHRHDGGPAQGCEGVVVAHPDVFDGPFHTNDALDVVGSGIFLSSVTSAWVTDVESDEVRSGLWSGWPVSGSALGPFGLGHASTVMLPSRPLSATWDPPPTCRFRGPTLLRFDGRSLRVTSPLSIPSADAGAEGSLALGCPGIDRSLLGSPTRIDLPDTVVIEVIPADPSTCVLHPLGLPLDEDRDREWSCGAGDAFVWGRYLGLRTVAAHGDIQIVWDLERGDAAARVPDAHGAALALIARGSVVLRRPVGIPLRLVAPFGRSVPFAGEGQPPFGEHPLDAPSVQPLTWDEPRIEAAIVALGGSLRVQNVRLGEEQPGPIRLHGSVTQRFRGRLHLEHRSQNGFLIGRTGYPRLELRYDPALQWEPPPGLPPLDPGRLIVLHLEEVDPEDPRAGGGG